jgi:DUF1365 family protein
MRRRQPRSDTSSRSVPRIARYDCLITHARRIPVLHRFVYRSPLWLVDLDDVPELPRPWRFLASFDAADHWDGRSSLRAGLDEFLAAHGTERPARAEMFTGARSLGHVFNPLTVYWCYDATGAVEHVVAEVHNTYRGRHAYLLNLDDAGRDEVDKEFYVSPFFAAEGQYRMRIKPPGDTVDVVIALEQGGAVPFTATLHGRRRWSGRWSLALRPLAQLRVAALIRWQGIQLWRRGVIVQPRTGSPELLHAVRGNLRPEIRPGAPAAGPHPAARRIQTGR